jgi:hypothetical protein
VSGSLARDVHREDTPKSGPSCLEPLIKAAVCRYDAVLIGMVAAGLGLEAICSFLGLSGATLQYNLFRLGLKEPHSRPVRKGGRKAWSTLDVMRLIAYRVACVHPATIAAKLDRSVSGVYAKLRRLGVPAPPRVMLRRCTADALAQPELDFGFPGESHEADDCNPEPYNAPSPSASTSSASGPASTPHQTGKPRAGSPRCKASAPKVKAQRELPLLRSLPTQALPSALVSTPLPVEQQTELQTPAPPPVEPAAWTGLCFGGVPVPYLTDDEVALRLSQRFIVRDPVVIMNLSMRVLGGWSYTAAALRFGTTASKLASLLNFIDMPRDGDRTKYGDAYDLECGIVTFKLSGYVLERCRQYPDRAASQQSLFWSAKGSRGQKLSRKAMMKRFDFADYERHRSQPITLIRRCELDAKKAELARVESPASRSAGNSISRSQLPLQESLRMLQGGSYEERERGSNPPPIRPRLSGKSGEQMPWTYTGNGRAAGGLARP